MKPERKIRSINNKEESAKIRFGRFSLSYDIPVIFSLIVSSFTVISGILSYLSGPSAIVLDHKIGLSIRNHQCYDGMNYIAPIIQFSILNMSGSEKAHVELIGSTLTLSETLKPLEYEHDRFLQSVPGSEDCKSYVVSEDYEFPFFAVDQNSGKSMTALFRPLYNGDGKKDNFLDFQKSISDPKNDRITATFSLKILNAGMWKKLSGRDTIAFECKAVINQEIRMSALKRNFFDVRPNCRQQ